MKHLTGAAELFGVYVENLESVRFENYKSLIPPNRKTIHLEIPGYPQSALQNSRSSSGCFNAPYSTTLSD
jgi:hypothetical protein